MRKSTIAIAIAACLGAGVAQSAQIVVGPNGAGNYTSDSANFTMLQPNGAIQGGTNDVNLLWTGTAHTSITDYTGPGSQADMTISSTTAFSSNLWTAHDVQVFTPGTYTFDPTLGGGAPETGIAYYDRPDEFFGCTHVVRLGQQSKHRRGRGV